MVTRRLLSGPTFALCGGFMDAYYVSKNNYCSKITENLAYMGQ